MGLWMISVSAGEWQEDRLGKCIRSDRALPSPSFLYFLQLCMKV